MKISSTVFLRLMGFNRPAPTNAFGRATRFIEKPLTGLLLVYMVLQACPQIVFANSFKAGNITVYSRSPLPAETFSCIQRATSLVQHSELALPNRNERVFICNSPWVYRVFAPLQGQAFALSIPVTNNVFIASADVKNDHAFAATSQYNRRNLSTVVAHEITHGLIRAHLGLLKGMTLPKWVAEGYCDYVAGESSFPIARGLHLMKMGQSDPSPSFSYFVYREMVLHLMDDMHLSFDEVVARSSDFDTVQAETVRALRAAG